MRFKIRKRSEPYLNVAPLVDVVLLLLVFFMLTTTFVWQPGIELNLPRADSAMTRVKQESVIILTKDGRIFFNEGLVAEKDLEQKMRGHFKSRSDSFLILKADKDVSHGKVVEVMDLAKKSGAARIAIATEPKKLK